MLPWEWSCLNWRQVPTSLYDARADSCPLPPQNLPQTPSLHEALGTPRDQGTGAGFRELSSEKQIAWSLQPLEDHERL